jgi:hypothetical protein
MAPPKAAATVPLSDLGSYQHAVRLVLTHDVITATRPARAPWSRCCAGPTRWPPTSASCSVTR